MSATPERPDDWLARKAAQVRAERRAAAERVRRSGGNQPRRRGLTMTETVFGPRALEPSQGDASHAVWLSVLDVACPDGHAEQGAPCFTIPRGVCGSRIDRALRDAATGAARKGMP